MVGTRTAAAVFGILGSLLVSAALWWYFDSLVFFLFVPFVPLLLGRSGREDSDGIRQCPSCGFRTAESAYDYCPRDGTRLERPRGDEPR